MAPTHRAGRLVAAPARLRAYIDRTADDLRRAVVEVLEVVRANQWFLADAKQERAVDRGVLLAMHHEIAVTLPEQLLELITRVDGLAERLRSLQEGTERGREELQRRLDLLDARARNLAAFSAALSEQLAAVDPPQPVEDLLVSVVVATRDRGDVLGAALASVRDQTYRHWECVVVDDGSSDATASVIEPFLQDERFLSVAIQHRGVGAARNEGLRRCRGDVITYLDSDNVFDLTYLARLVEAYQRDPTCEWTVAHQIMANSPGTGVLVRELHLPTEALEHGNFIDLNALAHRRRAIDDLDPVFDETLPRLSDWDLVRRLVARAEPTRLPILAGVYDAQREDRISVVHPLAPYDQRVRRRFHPPVASGLRVLLAEWHFPQITESYVRTELEALLVEGASVQVWSEETETAAPYATDVVVRYGDVVDALRDFEPDVVLSHWTNKAEEFQSKLTGRVGLFVVRTHGFEFDADRTARLLADPSLVVHTFPHLLDARWADHPRVIVTPSAFSEARFPPRADKDRRLVVRTAAGLHAKEVPLFFEVAKRCPDHRFVLVLGHAYVVEAQTEELIAERDRLGAPVEILVDLTNEQAANLVGEAGIYLHTHGTTAPWGMSISIAEAMATGSFVVARDLPGMAGYLGPHGARYDGDSLVERADAAAAIILGTTRWTEEEWHRRWLETVEHAYRHYASGEVVGSMLQAWKRAEPSLPIRPTGR